MDKSKSCAAMGEVRDLQDRVSVLEKALSELLLQTRLRRLSPTLITFQVHQAERYDKNAVLMFDWSLESTEEQKAELARCLDELVLDEHRIDDSTLGMLVVRPPEPSKRECRNTSKPPVL